MGNIEKFFANSLRNRLIFATVVVAFISVLMVGGYAVWVTTNVLQEQIAKEQAADVNVLGQGISNFLSGLEQDVRFLSNSPNLQKYLQAKETGVSSNEVSDALEIATQEFFAFAQARKVYDQVRFLDSTGNEIIRVNTSPDGISTVVPFEYLQNKGDRYYFADTVALQPGELFVSPLDLNVESGAVEVLPDGSYKPVIRYGTPVELNGEVVGVIVTNVLAENFLQLLQSSEDLVYLVDADGYYLYHPDEAKRWGRDLDTGATIFDDYSPEAVDQLLASQAGTFSANDNFFAHQAVSVPNAPEITWYLGAVQPQSVITQPIIGSATGFAFVALLVLGLAVVAAVLIDRSVARPIIELSQAALRVSKGDYNVNIEPKSTDEIGTLAHSFNTMSAQVQGMITTLEARVHARTQALEASAEISRQITNILDLDELLLVVVNQIQNTFDYYHVHIYLVNQANGYLEMREGTGEIGQKLKEQNRKLEIGHGIVGSAVQQEKPLLVTNVNNAPDFVRNPLLPKTQAELAVPIVKSGQVLGVLDMQSEQIDGFSEEDLVLMQSIADQVAIAVDNARLFRETRQALADLEKAQSRYLGTGWQQALADRQSASVQQIVPDAPSIDDKIMAQVKKAVAHGQKIMVTPSTAGNGNGIKQSAVAVPLRIRGKVIGNIRIHDTKNPRPWSDEQVALLETVGDQMSLALENARLMEEQGKTIVQLKEVDRLKSEFLTSMSHELRTPLNSIIGFADVLLQGIDGELNELVTNDVQLIYNSGQHLLALINDVLDLSKIEAEKMELVLEDVNIKNAIDEVLASASSLTKNKPVEIVVDTEPDLPPITADRLRLTQIMLNLVSNAAKFTDEGSITLSARLSEENPDMMRISVKDTGIGISEEKLETIFDRFRQADSSTTRKYGGTGLGLAITRKLVELHSGEIHARSDAEEGSEFYFTIPLVTQPALTEEN